MNLSLPILIALIISIRSIFGAPLISDFRIITTLDSLGFYFVEGVQVQSVAVSEDGKVWVTARALVRTDPDTYETVELVLRYLSNGLLDQTFHNNGKLLGLSGELTALPGGAMLAGTKRIHSDGSIDMAFTPSHLLNIRAVQQDGKIVSAGNELRRCLPDGRLDEAFSSDGKATLLSDALDLLLQADEKILVLGNDYSVSRFNADGSIDADFGSNGRVQIAMPTFGGTGFHFADFAITLSGSFILSGSASRNTNDFAVVRFTPAGDLDSAFGTQGVRLVDGIAPGGIAEPPYSNGFTQDETLGVRITDDESIIVAGSSDSHCAMFRLTPDGQLDPFFGGNEGRVLAANPGFNQLYLADFAAGAGVKYYLVGATDWGIGPVNGIALFGFSGGQPTPRVAASSEIAFDPVRPGESQIKSVSIRNSGNAELRDLVVTKEPSAAAEDFSLGSLSAGTVSPGDSVEFSVAFVPSETGTREALLLVHSNDPVESPVRIKLTGRTATALEGWRIQNFGSPYNSGPGADPADPDSDGLLNLIEYAVASDPLTHSPPPGQLVKNGTTLEFTYSRRKAALLELSFVREFSQTLSGPWSQTGSTVETILADDGVLQTVRVNTPAGSAGRRFVRLRISGK